MSSSNKEVVNGYQIPKWAGKPPSGLHLDIMKEGKMIQKLMIDEKRFYFFGRNKEVCDFVTDHASCSRVHAVLIWHKHLSRSFLVDLGSAHGTFIGSIRLEAQKPQQVFIDSELRFGASTRAYVIRERPQINNKHLSSILTKNIAGGEKSRNNEKERRDDGNESNEDNDSENDNEENENNDEDKRKKGGGSGSSLFLSSLPESEAELDNLTEFNTAHNKRIAQLVVVSTSSDSVNEHNKTGGGSKKSVEFNEEEDVINPEDVDPSIGRFRNMVPTSVVVPSRKKLMQIQMQQQIQRQQQFQSIQQQQQQQQQPNNREDEQLRRARMLIQQEQGEEEDQDQGKSVKKRLNIIENQEEEEIEDDEPRGYRYSTIDSFNLAPDVSAADSSSPSHTKTTTTSTMAQVKMQIQMQQQQQQQQQKHQQKQQQWEEDYDYNQDNNEESASYDFHTKKKYAKEAWPGRQPGTTQVSPAKTTTAAPTVTTSHLNVVSKESPYPSSSGEGAAGAKKKPHPASFSSEQQSSTSPPSKKRLII